MCKQRKEHLLILVDFLSCLYIQAFGTSKKLALLLLCYTQHNSNDHAHVVAMNSHVKDTPTKN